MNAVHEYRYEINADDVIVRVGRPWLQFAKNNEAPELTRAAVEGRDVHLFIAGWKLSDLYRQLFAALRHAGRPAVVPFRCDSPGVKRFMELELQPRPEGHIVCTGRLLRRVARPVIPLLERGGTRSGEWRVICSVCRQLQLADDSWREIEQALADPYARPAAGLPLLSHDVCPACTDLFHGLMPG